MPRKKDGRSVEYLHNIWGSYKQIRNEIWVLIKQNIWHRFRTKTSNSFVQGVVRNNLREYPLLSDLGNASEESINDETLVRARVSFLLL